MTNATATADPYGMTNKRTGNCNCNTTTATAVMTIAAGSLVALLDMGCEGPLPRRTILIDRFYLIIAYALAMERGVD
jgi:hypothetical protein